MLLHTFGNESEKLRCYPCDSVNSKLQLIGPWTDWLYIYSVIHPIAARKAFSSTSSSRRSSNGCASVHDVEEEEEEQLFQEASSGTRTNSVDGIAAPFTAAVSATPVTDFYSNATVLITGGTGFVGKVLTEKLLRSFGLRKIYMLIRSKDNMSVQERLKGFFNESVSVRTGCGSLLSGEPFHAVGQYNIG